MPKRLAASERSAVAAPLSMPALRRTRSLRSLLRMSAPTVISRPCARSASGSLRGRCSEVCALPFEALFDHRLTPVRGLAFFRQTEALALVKLACGVEAGDGREITAGKLSLDQKPHGGINHASADAVALALVGK